MSFKSAMNFAGRSLFYLFSPFISIQVANRFYWGYGDFFESVEHNILFLIVFNLQAFATWSHWKAMTSDPGFVSDKHFVREGEQFEIEGPKKFGIDLGEEPDENEAPKYCSRCND